MVPNTALTSSPSGGYCKYQNLLSNKQSPALIHTLRSADIESSTDTEPSTDPSQEGFCVSAVLMMRQCWVLCQCCADDVSVESFMNGEKLFFVVLGLFN